MTVSALIHHARNTRPTWYNTYHNTRFSEPLHWIVLGFSTIMLLFGSITFIFHPHAAALSTTVTEELLPGDLGIMLPSFISFSPVISNSSYEQTSTAILNNVLMSDSRGTGVVGWSVTASATDFVSIDQPILQRGIHNTLTAGGTYNSSIGGTYIITITSGGDIGEAKFTVNGLETQEETITGKQIPIGTHGIVITFAPAEYVPGDSWLLRINTIPITNLTMTPVSLQAISGTKNGVSLGDKHTFAGNNDQTMIMMASNDHQAGSFASDLFFSLKIPLGTPAGTYNSTFTITTD